MTSNHRPIGIMPYSFTKHLCVFAVGYTFLLIHASDNSLVSSRRKVISSNGKSELTTINLLSNVKSNFIYIILSNL